MPARFFLTPIGLALAAALYGCTSTSQTTPAPSFAESAAETGADAGYALLLPDTVAVLPEPSGLTRVAASAPAAPTDAPAAQPAVAAAEPPRTAFAGSTPAAAPDKPAAPVFPAAPALAAAPAGVEVASIQPAAYSGPVPSYLDSTRPLAASGRGDIEKLIDKYALLYQVPADLVRRVVNRESTFNPRAYNRGHWGLMQIKHATARGMGYDGPASGLFDAETNLKYAVKYLRGAWLVAEGDARRADRLYQTGYYYEAKRKGMLEETGLGIDRRSRHRMKADDVRLDPEGIVRPPVLPVGAPG